MVTNRRRVCYTGEMTTEEKLEAIRALVKSDATNTDHYEDEDGDFNPMDLSGGNFDDAFSLGVDQGAGDLARAVLAVLDGE